jgi:hypothetical protein
MMTLSIRQPWAWAIFNGKDVENRTWATHFTGPLLIHSAKTFDHRGYDWIVKNHCILRIKEIPHPDNFIFGAIIGKVTMTDCVIHSSSKWFFGPYGFVFENPVLFKNPIPYRGALKLFDVPDELVKVAK